MQNSNRIPNPSNVLIIQYEERIRELRIIEHLISLNRSSMKRLDRRFFQGVPQHPPQIFHDEFHELYRNFCNLNSRRNELKELIHKQKPARLIVVYLPGDQRTISKVKPLKIEDALKNALALRNLATDMCGVYTSELYTDLISWDTKLIDIDHSEVFIKIFNTRIQLRLMSHCFKVKRLQKNCSACNRFIFSGFHCEICNFKFHKDCASKVPIFCGLH